MEVETQAVSRFGSLWEDTDVTSGVQRSTASCHFSNGIVGFCAFGR